ncbi:R3H domain protein [Tasmannia lanceolata]|uniref:R3H domain protein n=1 Tax=Tasmannia lanceolata TaxID=3420 RepID=UPI004062F783
MANSEVLKGEEDILGLSIFSPQYGGTSKSRGLLIERKIELLENLASKVSNRRSRRWLNDRLLIELVPRLNVEEIRGLFAPPPWGDDVPLSPFCMTNMGEWDAFRNVDMDKEVTMIESLQNSSTKRKEHVDTDKMAALKAWHRVDCRTREALRSHFLSKLVQGYEECVWAFIKDSKDGDVLVLHVQDSFHRLLLHGVCEFYDLVSVTTTAAKGAKLSKMVRIKKKKSGSREIPNITLTRFLKMAKNGFTDGSP